MIRTCTDLNHVKAAAIVAEQIPEGDRYTYEAFRQLVKSRCTALKMGFPSSDRQFRRWIDAIYSTPDSLFGRAELKEALILAYWLSHKPRKGVRIYQQERLLRETNVDQTN